VFEWKPPDPRIVAFVRRIQDALDRRLGGRYSTSQKGGPIADETAGERDVEDALVDPLPSRWHHDGR
jgi:hypothetical protein